MSDDDSSVPGQRALTTRKVGKMISDERKLIVDEISQSLSDNLAKSLKSSLAEELRESLMTGFESIIIARFEALETKLLHLEETITANQSDVARVFADIESIKETNEHHANEIVRLTNENLELCNQMEQMRAIIDELDERVEERTNRSLRQTLIFRGVKGSPNEKWSVTTDKLANTIAGVLDTSFNDAHEMINRAHRGGKDQRYIYANFFSWLDCEEIVEAFRNDTTVHVYVDYKYGPKTTFRRNEALALRKQMKADGDIVKGYVKYPAMLMVKYSMSDTKYTMHKNLSKIKVVWNKRASDQSVVSNP